MEFRCRLGTTSGEIIEGVYVAQSEAALRRELEDKGLHVLSLKPRLGFGGSAFGGESRQGQASRVSGVQPGARHAAESGHAARPVARYSAHRASAIRCSSRCSTTCTRKCEAARRCLTRSARTAICFRRVYTASLMAGERCGQPRRRAAPLCRVFEDRSTRSGRRPISAMIYPVILCAGGRPRRHHRHQGRADVRGLLRQLRRRAAAVDAHHRGGVGRHPRASSC